jgi:hypothetical protein
MKTETIELPIYYATYFMYNDTSVLDVSDYNIIKDIEKTLKDKKLGSCLDVSDETYFKFFNGLGFDVCEYTFAVL